MLFAALAETTPGTAAHQRAGSALFPVLWKPLCVFLEQRVDPSVVEELTQQVITVVMQKAGTCAAVKMPPTAISNRVAWRWVYQIAKYRRADELARNARFTGLDESGRDDPLSRSDNERRRAALVVAPAGSDNPVQSAAQLLRLSFRAVRGVVREDLPADLRALASKLGIGGNEDAVKRNVRVWIWVKILGMGSDAVALRLSYRQGTQKELSNRVAKHTQRGKLALGVGASAASRTEQDPSISEDLTQMAHRYLANTTTKKQPRHQSETQELDS